ncbi:hypothetical protein BDV23DRAFT_173701 [Aspergillus alliaceus]|uniref:Uncharacterized protein n=1 Tax=Petromyces alliaceus TaxID=209559 RepID=A0A5N7C3W7_PETAA|nr:hypothetical protein BDV23DRAFT_173701 [Aspergillus alliaceus]
MLGTSIINHLAKLVPPLQLIFIAGTRRFEQSFTGVDMLMLISYASIQIEYRSEAHKNAIRAAHRSSVSNISYSSLVFDGNFEKTSVCHVMGAHLATETDLATELPRPIALLTYIAICEGLYSDLFSIYLALFDQRNLVEEITIPQSGSGLGIAWAKRNGIGEATANMIVSYTAGPEILRFLNQVVLLSRPEVMSLGETVRLLGRAVGKSSRFGRSRRTNVLLCRKLGEYTSCWETFRRSEAAVVLLLLGEILARELGRFETTFKGNVGKVW